MPGSGFWFRYSQQLQPKGRKWNEWTLKGRNETSEPRFLCFWPVSLPLRLTNSGLFFQSKVESKWRKRSRPTWGELSGKNKQTITFNQNQNMKKRDWESVWNKYLGGVKGAGCRKSEATSRSAASSIMSPLKSCAASQRLARRHTAPKHGCCCCRLTHKSTNKGVLNH